MLGAIDAELYAHGVIWCQKFVDRVADAYDRTVNGAPQRPDFLVNVKNKEVSANKNLEKAAETPQTKLNKTKLNKTKLNKTKLQSISQKFDIFWKAYPKKKSKGDAEKAFEKVNPDKQLLATMLAKIEQAKKSTDWLKDSGQFIPYPATWLNRKCWEDEFQETKGGRGEQRGKGVRPKPAQERRRGPLTRIPGDKEPEG